MSTRNQAERDAETVEIVYAIVSAVVLGCLAGVVVASPILFLGLHGSAMRTVSVVAGVCAAGVLLWRLVTVLWRFEQRRRG